MERKKEKVHKTLATLQMVQDEELKELSLSLDVYG